MRASMTRAPVIGIDTEPVPCQVGERQPGHDLDVDARTAQQHDRALRHRRAARNRVRDLAVLVRGLDDPRRDRGVDRVEIVAGVVEEIERLEHEPFAAPGRRPRDDARCGRSAPGFARARRAPRATADRRRPDRARPRRRAAGSPGRDGATVVVVVVVGPAHVSPASRHTRGFGGVGGITANPVLPLASGALLPQVP